MEDFFTTVRGPATVIEQGLACSHIPRLALDPPPEVKVYSPMQRAAWMPQ